MSPDFHDGRRDSKISSASVDRPSSVHSAASRAITPITMGEGQIEVDVNLLFPLLPVRERNNATRLIATTVAVQIWRCIRRRPVRFQHTREPAAGLEAGSPDRSSGGLHLAALLPGPEQYREREDHEHRDAQRSRNGDQRHRQTVRDLADAVPDRLCAL